MDQVQELEAALRRALSMLAECSDDAGVPERELVAVEKRLKKPIPQPLRAFYRSCGRHAAMVFTDALGLRIVDPADLELKKGAASFIRGVNGVDFAIDFGSPEKNVVTRGPSGEKDSHRSLTKVLFDFAVGQVIVGMHNVYKGRSIKAPKGFELLSPTLSRELYCDPAMGILFRREYGEIFTVGAADSKVIPALETRLGARLKPYRLDGQIVWKSAPVPATEKKAKPATQTASASDGDAELRAALEAILRVRYGKAPRPATKPGAWLAEVEKKLGAKLPQPLVSFYAFVEADANFFVVDRMLVRPEKLAFANSVLKLGEENQGSVQWGVKKKDLALPDPPVFELGRASRKKPRKVSSLSAFLVQTAAWQTVFGMDVATEVRVDPDEADDVLGKLAPVFTNVGQGRFSTATQDCYVAPRERAIATVVRDAESVVVYFGASQETMEALEKRLDLPFEWL